jgi:hypothetical protein
LRYLKYFTACDIAAEGLDSTQFHDATIRRINRQPRVAPSAKAGIPAERRIPYLALGPLI